MDNNEKITDKKVNDPLNLIPKNSNVKTIPVKSYMPPTITPPTKGYVKLIWFTFWIIIGTIQIISSLLISDPSHFSMFPEGGLKDMIQDIPDDIRSILPHIVFGVIIPIWYLSIKYRHKTSTKILMSVISVPVIVIIGIYLVIAIAVITFFICIFWLASKLMGSGSKTGDYSGGGCDHDWQYTSRADRSQQKFYYCRRCKNWK